MEMQKTLLQNEIIGMLSNVLGVDSIRKVVVTPTNDIKAMVPINVEPIKKCPMDYRINGYSNEYDIIFIRFDKNRDFILKALNEEVGFIPSSCLVIPKQGEHEFIFRK